MSPSGNVRLEKASMIIYAIFLCMQFTGSCRLIGPTGVKIEGQWVMTSTFPTLSDCQKAIGHYVTTEPRHGRYYAGNGMWYECLSRRVETWQPQ